MTTPVPRGGRGLLIGSLVVVAVAVVALVIVLVVVLNRLAGSGPASKPFSLLGVATTAGACGPVPYEKTNTLTGAPSTNWELWGMSAIASSAQAGPKQKDADGIRTCYSRTAEGALYAVINFTAYCTDSRALVKAMKTVQDGPGRDLLVEQAKIQQTCDPIVHKIRGFRVDEYDGDKAVVTLAVEVSGRTKTAAWSLVWEDGDWKFQVNANDLSPYPPGEVQSLAGFTVWGFFAQ